jgi:hypothetical protein
MNLFKRAGIWFSVSVSFLFSFFGSKKEILTAEETVQLVKNNKSLIRFGDGEFGIFKKKNIHYQDWSESLLKDFEEIKTQFETDENCPYILAVPKRFMQVNGFKLMKKRVYVSSWAQARLDFMRNYSNKVTYADAFLFEKKNKAIYSELFDNTTPKNVIFVHNNEVYAKYFGDTYNKNVIFVKCPSKNAYDSVLDIESEISAKIQENGFLKDDVTLVISAGPAGKVLVYKFAHKGYHSIDAGHCWDEPLEDINA